MFDKCFSKKKLVCFDFDGLLVNTEPHHHTAYNNILDSLGFPLNLDFTSYCKIAHDKNRNLFEQTMRRRYPEFTHNWEDIRNKKTTLYRDLLESNPIPPMEGAKELVEKLVQLNIPICIVTNSERKDVDTISSHLPFLQSIPLIIAREDYELPKPAPDGYLKALKIHGIEAKDAIGLEDTNKGITALKNAGIDHLLINTQIISPSEREYHSLLSFVN